MRLYLLRHAPAISRKMWGKKPDGRRPLSAAGISQMKKVARGLRRARKIPGLILASPYERARRTAEITAGILRVKTLRLFRLLEPGTSPQRVLRQLFAKYAGRPAVMLVGHEPDLSRLLCRLLGISGKARRFKFEKSGFCELEVDLSKKKLRAALIAFLPPKILSAL